MANPVAVNDIIRCVFFNSTFEQEILTVLHYRCVTAPVTGSPTYDTSMLALSARLGDNTKAPLMQWQALASHDFFFGQVRAQRVSPTRDYYQNFLIVLEGSDPAACLTQNIAASIEKRSRKAGRQGIGKMQVGGIPAGAYAEGAFTTAFLTSLQALADNLPNLLTTPIDGGVYALCLWNGGPVTSDGDVMSCVVQDTVRTMRRRTLHVGK